MIKQLELRNFTIFNSIEADFSPKITIIIGENSTGKTHLLKAAYALSFCATLWPLTKAKASSEITTKLLRLFLPLENKLGAMRSHGASEGVFLKALFASDDNIAIGFNSNSKSIAIEDIPKRAQHEGYPIFIPTKEVLSFISGIANKQSDHKTILKLFDDTYLDLCSALLKKDKTVSPRIDLDPRFGTLFPSLVNSIHGRYEFDKGEFRFTPGVYKSRASAPTRKYQTKKTETVFKPIDEQDLSNNMTAEGFRKIGILQQLLANKALNPGASGPLFWDEPESNMNPKLMRLLVQTILDLSRNGQQIVLATHDYVLLKWFDLLIDKSKEDHVRFLSLSRSPKTNNIQVEGAESYKDLSTNAIAATFSDLYDEEIDRALGGNKA